MNKNEIKYLQFPVSMLPELIDDSEATIKKILNYGIYRFAKSMSKKKKGDIDIALKQFLYCYYRKKEFLTEILMSKIEKYISEGLVVLDEDYNGFYNESFNPESEINSLKAIIKTDSDFSSEILKWHYVYLSYSFFNFVEIIRPKQILEIGSKISSEIKPKEPMVSCKLEILKNFYKEEKNEYEKIQLVAYLAIRSILGEQEYVKTNKSFILCRMIGYASVKEMIQSELSNYVFQLFNKYNHRYHFEKLIIKLQLNWNLLSYSNHNRCSYMAIKSKEMTIEKLALIAEQGKDKTKILDLKQLKKNAKEQALKALKKRNQSDDLENFF